MLRLTLTLTLLVSPIITMGSNTGVLSESKRMIVADGKPIATILLEEGYGDYEKLAAIELQHYIEKSTGASLSIVMEPEQTMGYVIHIGVREPSEGEDSESFSIKVGPRSIDIIGNSKLGALYGVYDFLEEVVGVRWYLPGTLGEVVPEHKTLLLPPLNYKESPSFPMRWVGRVHPKLRTPKSKMIVAGRWDRWMLRNKQNAFKDGFNIYPNIYHTQHDWLSHEEYFEEHPEYFALIDGKRSTQGHAKLCYSNPEVAREIAKNMSAALDSMPGIDMVSFSPTDGQLWCDCDSCRAMDEEGVPMDQSKSRRSLIFYNRIASELKKTHPEAKILVGAYNVYNWPPKDRTIKADPMLNVIITHYQNYCLAHPVPDPTCPPNKRYVELIKKWEDLVGDNIYFYEYYWKVNWLDLPWPIVHSIKEDMPWYKEQGYQGLYTQYTLENIWTLYPNYYVAARLLWEEDANVDSLVDKMYEDLFKEASPWIKKYYSLMEKQTAECGEHFPGNAIIYNPERRGYGPAVFTEEVRRKLREYYQKAVEANEDPTVARRLERIGTSLEYVERLMHYSDLRENAKKEDDLKEAYALANQALAVGEALRNEINRDRIKWGGIIAPNVAKPTVFLGKMLSYWREYVDKIKPW